MTETPSASDKPIKVLIVDDHPVVRAGLIACIAQYPSLLVCGEAGDLAEAAHIAKETVPDLILLDISLKGQCGLELIKLVKAHHKDVRFLVASMYDESVYAERALRAGANGYINKQELTATVIDAIHQVFAGEVYLSGEMTRRLLNRSVGTPGPTLERSPVEALSDRELEIFELIGRGLTLKEIAEQLHRSVHTVQSHRENIRQKLCLANSFELSRRALQWILDKK